MNKEFNLSDERELLKSKFDKSMVLIDMGTKRSVKLFDIVEEVLSFVEMQDREFIKELKGFIEKEHERMNGMALKECGYDNCWGHEYIKEIDKLAGDKLTKENKQK